LEEQFKKNVFVMTRDQVKDYYWITSPMMIDKKSLLTKMNDLFIQLHKNGIFTSEWYRSSLNGQKFVFRVVIDGRLDSYGRLIRRYEGMVLDNEISVSIADLENYLAKLQVETDNYNYGKIDEDTLRIPAEEIEEATEECLLELKDGKITLRSNLITQFLQNHSLDDLLDILAIEPNDPEKTRQI